MSSWQTFSTRPNKALFWTALAALTVLSALGSLWFGSVSVSPAEVLTALLGRGGGSTAAKIVLYSRLPRTCAALLAGAALAVSGAVIQTVLNNPLASPGIIGVNSGAGLAVAVLCAIAPTAQRLSPLAAFAGAVLGVLLVLGLAERTGASRMTLVLAGVAISNLFSAGIDAVVTLVPDALTGVTDFRIGGFHGVTMARLALPAALIAVSLLAVLSLSQQLDILALGGDTARSLGLAVGPVRIALLVLAAALAGAAVSFSGLLGFVGLIVPHAMRRLAGEDSFPLLLSSALGGACFVTVCDLLARVLFAPFELPVGVVLAFTGAPFFLWLLFRQRGGRL
ncbi:FecCD family ABC transporter permease [Dysosmobacter sp.]|uniref:FecCD family ABC transporter permease n=1 Tax=Dysosmobacter sp. TaxID=2591382 RepID=UPI002A8F4CD3|nr:iron ABC transporter permease [Dysosmobacter sp.]MDY3281740.1 iron ABC transporter permease [Dysosmobacter sp.]